MKKYLILLALAAVTVTGAAQSLVISSRYRPLSVEEMVLQVQAETYYQQKMKERFEEYQDKAYIYYNKGDYKNFITYSDYALQTGWYTGKLYYDRGYAYECLREYRKAKKEYKRAIKKEYSPAQYAYEQCKIHHKACKEANRQYDDTYQEP
jgi:tetratricopeptide (TPR) repeat protein